MNYDTIRLDHDNGILWLTLNRPQMLNAFTLQMADELIDAFGRASDDDAVRVVIVTGEGKGFCAGMDLGKEGANPFGFAHDKKPTLADMDICLEAPAAADGVRDSGGRVALAIMGCTKPVIAAGAFAPSTPIVTAVVTPVSVAFFRFSVTPSSAPVTELVALSNVYPSTITRASCGACSCVSALTPLPGS